MAKLITHKFVSTIPDGDDASLVKPSNWNDTHDVSGVAESGANSDITSMTGVTGGISTPDFIQFDTTATPTIALGKERWNVDTGTLAFGIIDGTTEVNIGQQIYAQVHNAESVTITKGQAVYLYQATGNKASVKLAYNTGDATSAKTLGLAAQDITAGGTGFITTQGVLDKLNTGAYNEGDTLYLGATAGSLTATKPFAPNHLVYIGVVERANNGNGQIYVRVQNGYELDEIHDVQITAPKTTGQTLVYDQPTDLWKNSNAVVVSGGSVNNSPIGATTPSTGNFTTLTAQTEVLRGTGQNLFTYSEQFNNANWAKTSSSISATDSTVAPNGTTTADTYLISNASAQHFINQSVTCINNSNYTLSVYIKKNTVDFAQLILSSTIFGSNVWANFDIVNGILGTVGSATTATITSAGNNWFRCSITGLSIAAGSANISVGFIASLTDARLPTYLGNGTDSLYLWGGQFELASSVGTYIQTVATAVYGTPTLSFSGVAEIGLQSNGALYLQPAGTGAIQAQATTSSATGGNARGANAVDWQTSRDTATKVASGGFSTLAGGYANIVNATYAATLGGDTNTASGARAVAVAGVLNTASGTASSLVGGYGNTAAGFLNFIGGGYANSGTANAAVTTQATSAVTSGSTAVTLTGSNANIKVGQLITGTGINTFPNTYVAAISGTSLTLSQNANATGTPTLSFFTPHGVVVGGGNNQATGSYSFIGGGGDAGTAGNRNVASGDWSFVGGGLQNVASGIGAVVCGGGTTTGAASGNTASGTTSTICGGANNTASGTQSFIGGGLSNVAAGAYSSVVAGRNGTVRAIQGNMVFPACTAPIANTSGVSQAALLVLGVETTDATATVLRSNSSAATTTNQVILPNNSAYYFRGEIVAGVTGGGNTKGWFVEGVIKRGANAASTAIVGTATVTSNYADAGASTWAVTATADTTNGGLKIEVTGQASTTIRWVAQIRTTEMTY